MLLSLAILFLSSPNVLAKTADWKITQAVETRLQKHGSADVIFLLREKANLAAASQEQKREMRIRLVYDELRKVAKQSQASFLARLENENIPYRSFYLINAVAVEGINAEQAQALADQEEIASVELDFSANLQLPESEKSFLPLESLFSVPDHLKLIGVDKAWQDGNQGFGIVIAGQDSGYRWDHPALKTQYRGNSGFLVQHDYHWHDAIRGKIGSTNGSCGYSTRVPCDDSGHGTHTMGTMVGFEWATKTNSIGVAPQAKWIGCRNMDKGVGRASTYLECFEFFLAPYPYGGNPQVDGNPAMAPHIINNSWACPSTEGCTGGEFVQAIDALQAAGILVVASAGNDGPGCASVGDAPGSYSGKIFSVAASDHRNGEIAYFSSRGPSKFNGGLGPNITAPGNNIRSAVPSGGLGDGGLYDYKSGTSMSGPHIAGVVALLWSAKPELIGKILETIRHLEKTATPKTSSQSCGKFSGNQIPNAVFGYGVVDAYRAINTAVQ
jgi:serine protease AprX